MFHFFLKNPNTIINMNTLPLIEIPSKKTAIVAIILASLSGITFHTLEICLSYFSVQVTAIGSKNPVPFCSFFLLSRFFFIFCESCRQITSHSHHNHILGSFNLDFQYQTTYRQFIELLKYVDIDYGCQDVTRSINDKYYNFIFASDHSLSHLKKTFKLFFSDWMCFKSESITNSSLLLSVIMQLLDNSVQRHSFKNMSY